MTRFYFDVGQYFLLFTFADALFSFSGLEGVYYLIHFLHNAAVVKSTATDVWLTLTDFDGLQKYEPNYHAASLVFGLHLYHIARYWEKLRYDDWLHHITMIFVGLPIGVLVPSSTLLGYSLFFTTGLPGGIDYLMLFLVRNGWLGRMREKQVNRWLNVWIRSPGCVSHAVITFLYAGRMENTVALFFSIIPALLNYWNGQYFMDQVVTDYAKQIQLFAPSHGV
jgi:hypothetical protein